MEYLKHLVTGKKYPTVYFKHNNGEVLVEHIDALLDTGNYELIKEENS